MSTDERLNVHKTDLAVITGIAYDLHDTQTRIARLLLIQEQRIRDLREVLNEWRTPLA